MPIPGHVTAVGVDDDAGVCAVVLRLAHFLPLDDDRKSRFALDRFRARVKVDAGLRDVFSRSFNSGKLVKIVSPD